MSRGPTRSAIDGPVPRLLALLVGVGCFALIGLSWLEQKPDPARTALPGVTQLAPAAPKPVADAGDCRARKLAEMDKLKAEGKLSAEQSMMMRQAIAKECG